MSISDGYTDVPDCKVASIVTSLQMFKRPQPRGGHAEATWALKKVDSIDPDSYRTLFRRVGEDWLWFSRLELSDDELRRVLAEPARELYVFKEGQERGDAGLLELDFGTEGQCELAFFGLMPHMIGLGAGRWLMNRALDIAWSRPIRRLWVHTCTFDHPGALDFYIRTGFVPFHRQIEVADDPRITGVLPESAAPHVPLLKSG
ncbi:MAG: GNAT family N-acetyltransferase [Gammaproteobacteria bacterium]|nr:GNAT family N-acetyltransferase [Gammaproteobacteria bacterium]MDE0366883.1 GNAT family N-acetyltransferase [Gammaproteobacteria bacterium]